MRESFIFYKSFVEAGSSIKNKTERLQFYEAIFNFALTASENKLEGVAKGMYSLVKPQLLANQKRWENGSKGGTKAKPKQNQERTETEPNLKKDDTETKPNNNVECSNVECSNENNNENENVVISETVVSEEVLPLKEKKLFEKIVEVWFSFHFEKYGFQPIFRALDGKKIKSIIEKLKKLSEQKNFEFTDTVAENAFLKFLTIAHSDDWLKSNFELSKLDSKFNSVIQKSTPNGSANYKIQKQSGADMASYREQLVNDLQGTK